MVNLFLDRHLWQEKNIMKNRL